MFLTRPQERILQGEAGDAAQLAMQLLARVGDVYGADRLVRITSAHVLAHYGSLHQAGIELYQRLQRTGRFAVLTTVNPASVDLEHWEQLGFPRPYVAKQQQLARAFQALGGIPCWSCIHYQYCNVPRPGQVLAWSESSAVCYANSVIGARTNRLTAGLDLACALLGLTPRFGLLEDESRRATLLVRVTTPLRDEFDYQRLGYWLGKSAGTQVPVLEGVPRDASPDQLKVLGAAAASSGSVAMYHAVGVTPAAQTRDQALGCDEAQERLEVTKRELQAAGAELDQTDRKPDLVALGGPQYSLSELLAVARLLRGRRVRKGIRLWIYTSAHFARLAGEAEVGRTIAASGAVLTTSTCAEVQPLEALGVHCLMTNSAKFAHSIPTDHKVAIRYAPLRECVKVATER
jgi:hypothetical protein